MQPEQIEYFIPQFEVLSPILELNIEPGFNRLRNALIHPKLNNFSSVKDIKTHRENTFWKAIDFFDNYKEKLKEAALTIHQWASFVNENDMDVNKISFDPVIQGGQISSHQKLSIYHHYYFPLEMIIDEIENLQHLLTRVEQPYSSIAIDAINNLCESIVGFSKEMQMCYDDNDGSTDPVWDKLDKLYKSLHNHENETIRKAIQMLDDGPRKRIRIVHGDNNGTEQREVMLELELLNILQEEYFIPSRDILKTHRYDRSSATTNFNTASTAFYQNLNRNSDINNNNSRSLNNNYD